MTCIIFYVQAGQSSTVIENIHTIIAAAAAKFNFDQLSHLFVLIQKVLSFILWTLSSLWAVSDCDCVFRAGRWRVIAWDRSFWVWLDGSAGRLALRQPQEKYASVICIYETVYFCLLTKTELKVGLWTRLAANKLQCWNVTASDWCRTTEAGESLHCNYYIIFMK